MKRKFDNTNDDGPRKRPRLSYHGNSTNNTNNNNNSITKSESNDDSQSAPPTFKGFAEGISRSNIDWNDNKKRIELQHVDTDYYIGFPPGTHKHRSSRDSRAIIRIFGVTNDGHSVLAHVIGFVPYFYVETWPGFEPNTGEEQAVQNYLNNQMQRANLPQKSDQYIPKVVSVKRRSLWGWTNKPNAWFLKIYTALPTQITKARSIAMNAIQTKKGNCVTGLTTFESNMTYTLRFMIDLDIVGAGWIGIDSNEYSLVAHANKSSSCSLEVTVRWDHMKALAGMDGIAPLRILSFDIECMCSEGFPQAERQKDQIIQISNVCYIQKGVDEQSGGSDPKSKKDKSGDYFHKNVFCLGTCSPIAGCNIYSYPTEKELLIGWSKFVRQLDPDILTGYNIVNFDLPYLINRAGHLKISDQFCYLGRLNNGRTIMKDSSFSSKAYGTLKSKDISIYGRIQMDLLPIIRRNHKLRSYSLNSVSYHFLKQQKEDVHYSIMGDLQNGDCETRRRLAVYCLKDSVLPLRLIDKLQTTINLIEMARVTGVPMNFLITRGQQIKVLSQLYRKAKSVDLLIPFKPRNAQNSGSEGTKEYEGATVIAPLKGYYKCPIATLDFASLYPSIMIAHNLCYSTIICDKRELESLNDDDVTKTEFGTFVKEKVSKGMLPQILQELLVERRKVKKMMKSIKNKASLLYAVYNGRQLALKVSANSVYGFTGATVGSLPCIPISASVTWFGRNMIDNTKKYVEENYTKTNGFESDAKVIYGDTDSVMIKFGDCDVCDVAKAMEMGKLAAEKITKALFITPISLEFEKVYFPYLLMNKKRYAGMLWTSPEKWDYMDAKGIETVRRDNCELVKNVVQTVLNYVLIERDVNSAVEYTKKMISLLLRNEIDLSSLVVSKQLGKLEDYKSKIAHVELAKKMAKRGDSLTYKTGDRVAYVITKGRKKAPAFEKAEDPLFTLENNLSLDTNYYLQNMLRKPLERIFGPILGDDGLKQLFCGQHTRTIKINTSNVGAMMMFVVRHKSCIGCKCILKKKNETVCDRCKKNESQLFMKQMDIVRKKEKVFHELWTQCQRCQGSLHQEVLCSNRDCPIFYKRTKVKKDLMETTKLLKQFEF